MGKTWRKVQKRTIKPKKSCAGRTRKKYRDMDASLRDNSADYEKAVVRVNGNVTPDYEFVRYFEACTKQAKRRSELWPFYGHVRTVRRYDEPDKRREETRALL